MRQSCEREAGISLLELVLVIVILGVVGVGMLTLINTTTRASADPQVLLQANAIARSYLEEILLRPFCDPDYDPDGDPATPTVCPVDCTTSACGACAGAGTPPLGARATFDDVCDYAGLADGGAVDQTGTAVPGLESFNVAVDVDDTIALNGLSGGAGEVVLVTVNVTHAGNARVNVNLSGYRTNF